jgi:hypothetical protein
VGAGAGVSSIASPNLSVLAPSASLTISHASTLASGANLTATTSGTITFQSPNAGSGIVAATLGTMTLNTNGKLNLQTAASHADRRVMTLSALSIDGSSGAWNGTVDIGGNDLILHNASSAAAATRLASLISQARSGLNPGGTFWNGAGLKSSAAAADARQLMAIGMIVNDNGSGAKLFGSGAPNGMFDGQDAATTDILTKETFFGDTNNSGSVDAADYSNTDNGYAMHLTGWINGDFNYDGTTNSTDYTLIDTTNAFQVADGAPLAAADLGELDSTELAEVSRAAPMASSLAAIDGGSAAIPEPRAISLLAAVTSGLLSRRRMRSSRIGL